MVRRLSEFVIQAIIMIYSGVFIYMYIKSESMFPVIRLGWEGGYRWGLMAPLASPEIPTSDQCRVYNISTASSEDEQRGDPLNSHTCQSMVCSVCPDSSHAHILRWSLHSVHGVGILGRFSTTAVGKHSSPGWVKESGGMLLANPSFVSLLGVWVFPNLMLAGGILDQWYPVRTLINGIQ